MGDLKAFFVFTKHDGSREIREFPRRKTAPINFFYDTMRVFVFTDRGCEPQAISWGDEGREIKLEPIEIESPEFVFAQPWLERLSESGSTSNPGESTAQAADQWFCSELNSHKVFINHLMFGEFAIDVLLSDSLEHLGRFSRSDIVSGGSNLPWKHYLNICSVVYGSRKSLIFDEFFRSRSNVHLFVRSGMPPRPLGQIMSFYRRLEPILKGVLAGDTVLPNTLIEVRELRTYNRGIRLDALSIKKLVSGELIQSRAISSGGSTGAFVPRMVDIPTAKSQFLQLDNKLFVQLLNEVSTGLNNFVEDLNVMDGALARQAQVLNHDVATLAWRYKIDRFGPLVAGIPDKYIRSADPQLKKLGSLISEWNSYYDLDMQERDHTQLYSVHTTEVLWEFFCFEKLIRALSNVGFVEERREKNRILLQRADLQVAIQYGGSWKSGSQTMGLKNLHLSKELKPDYVVTLTSPSFRRIGVLDAKYTPDPRRWESRSNELFEKYGLYLRKSSNDTLDFVLGLVPSAVGGERTRLLKVSHMDDIDLDLGYVSLQMTEDDASGEQALITCVLGKYGP